MVQLMFVMAVVTFGLSAGFTEHGALLRPVESHQALGHLPAVGGQDYGRVFPSRGPREVVWHGDLSHV